MAPVRLAAELGISPKTLRAFLRRQFPRGNESLGNEWILTGPQVEVVRRHFASSFDVPAPIKRAAPKTAPATSSSTAERFDTAPLRKYLRPNLDVLFVALNPPTQSAANRHWFSGKQSAFFRLLYRSGLITSDLPKGTADELVFGGSCHNYKRAHFGVTDLRPHLVEVNSGKVAVAVSDVAAFIEDVSVNAPRIVCLIHSKVRKEFNKFVERDLEVTELAEIGRFTSPLKACSSRFICNHFPNGNAIPDEEKVRIFALVRDAI